MNIAIIGAGVVGAAIAYELTALPNLNITVFEQNPPEHWQATGAALGVLIVGLSRRRKGRNFQLRQASLQRYETLIPELEALTQHPIPYNRQGILELCFNAGDWQQWQDLEHSHPNISLEQLSIAQVEHYYPMVTGATSLINPGFQGAVLCRSDRQVDPRRLTQALRLAAQLRGARFAYKQPVTHFSQDGLTITHVHTPTEIYPMDAVILAAGLGTTVLSKILGCSLPLQPVLGQALSLLSDLPHWQNSPVIQGEDVHIVPVSPDQVWVGATVEFDISALPNSPSANSQSQGNPEALRNVHQQAIALCPSLQSAKILTTWQGLRPRPQDQAAPVIQPITPYRNAWWATGHYRNGVLLAPITALKIRDLLVAALSK